MELLGDGDREQETDGPRTAEAQRRERIARATRRDGRGPTAESAAAADLSDSLVQIGLSDRASWIAGTVMYSIGGVLVVALGFADPGLVDLRVTLLGCAAIVIGILCGLATRRLGAGDRAPTWQLHGRLLGGLTMWVLGTAFLGSRAVPFTMLPLFSVLTPCYMHTWRLALGYVIAATAIIATMISIDAEPAGLAHTIVTTLSFLAIAASLVVTRARTAALALHNRRLAYTDPLTRVANTRALRERIAHEDRTRPFALFALDLDNFKQVNDSFDHSMGDRVLCAVAVALCGELGDGDLAARRGGDEFAAVVADPDERDLDALQARIERAIRAARAQACPAITPTASVGYVLSRPDEDLARLLERADVALHEAKARSRAARGGETPVPATDAATTHAPQPARGPGGLRGLLAHGMSAANPIVFFTAIVYGGAALALGGTSLAGLVRPLSPPTGGAIGLAMLLATIVCLRLARPGTSRRWLHVASLVNYALIGVALALADRSGTALADMLPAIGLFGFLMFDVRTAALYMFAAVTLFGAFAIGNAYAYDVTRTVVTVVAVAVVGGIVARLRLVTVDFARRARELSERDGLTGVGNLRALRSRMSHVIGRAHAGQATPLFLAIDLDCFKQVNDRHSHSLGDEVLVAVAVALTESIRIDDLVARRGGDEFVVVVDDAAGLDPEVLRERMADAIRRARLHACPDVRPTASIAALRWESGDDTDSLLRRADAALHEEKLRTRVGRGMAEAG